MKMIAPGLLVAVIVAAIAYVFSLYIPVSIMLIALILGFLLYPVFGTKNYFGAGISFSANAILKFGIICLGARINLGMIQDLGVETFLIIVMCMAATTCMGLWLGRKMGLSHALSILVAGAVSVCGSSAALAICSIFPSEEKKETDLVFVIVGVTILSTIGMITYPAVLALLDISDQSAGVVLGASLHNVAQAVGAGFLVSDAAGESATIAKLSRVSLLAPYVVIISLIARSRMKVKKSNKKLAILPLFVVGFLLVTCLNSFGILPAIIVAALIFLSKAALIVSIVAIGMRTSFTQVWSIDKSAIMLMVVLTLFLFLGALGAVSLT
jgi:uncharacterized integral membrane protein (TIGR00698 family)